MVPFEYTYNLVNKALVSKVRLAMFLLKQCKQLLYLQCSHLKTEQCEPALFVQAKTERNNMEQCECGIRIFDIQKYFNHNNPW